MAAAPAVGAVLEALLARVLANEAGVIAGAEPALHDYRVAVRRTRTAVSIFRTALPRRLRRSGARFFRDLGRRSNRARDLEVLLSELAGYARRVEETSGLASLERELARRRERESRAVGRWLRSKGYARGIEVWKRNVAKLAMSRSESSFESLASQAVERSARRLFAQSTALAGAEASEIDREIHRLRIRAKRLRYAIEFSSALAPGPQTAEPIERLEAVQDDLGAFQDRVVHAALLGEVAAASAGAPRRSRAAAAIAASLEKALPDRRRRVQELAERLPSRVGPSVERAVRAIAG